MRIIGVLLLLLGLTLLATPRITYNARETVIHSESVHVTAKRQKTIVIPRPAGGLAIAAGAIALLLSSRKTQA